MFKKRITDMKVCDETYTEVMKRTSKVWGMSNARFRSMLVSLKPGCYVEVNDERGGSVKQVNRDRYDIPLSVEVARDVYDKITREKIGEEMQDIDVEEITFWEPWDFIAPVYLFEDANAGIGELMFLSEVK